MNMVTSFSCVLMLVLTCGVSTAQDAGERIRVVRVCASESLTKVYRGAEANYEGIPPHIGDSDLDGSDAMKFIIKWEAN